jgi:hypothetical protein
MVRRPHKTAPRVLAVPRPPGVLSSFVLASLVLLAGCGPDFQQFLDRLDGGLPVKDTGGETDSAEDRGFDASETPDTGPSDTGGPEDAGADAAGDTGADAGPEDAGADTGTDGGFDSGPQHYFARTYGAGNVDRFHDIAQTSEGGFIAVSSTEVAAGNKDLWVVKLRPDGTAEWHKRYGGAADDEGVGIVELSDGYAVAGDTRSYGTAGDIWVLKLGANGDVVWQRNIGGSGDDSANSIKKTTTGFVVSGDTDTPAQGNFDALVVSLDESGNILWKKTYGGSDQDGAFFAQQTADGGFVVFGYSASFSGGNHDIWATKLTGDGTITWQKSYGGANFDGARAGAQTKEGGFVVVGFAGSTQGNDLNILKMDKDGAPQWQHRFGGTSTDDIAYSIVQTNDDGFAIAGTTGSYGTVRNAWLLRLAANGTFGWAARYGGTKNSEARAVRVGAGGGYVVAGFTEAYGAGGEDAWVLKIKADGTIDPGCPSDIGASTAVTPAQTSFAPVTTGASVGTPTINISGTQTTPAATSVSPQQQCASQ